MFWPNLSKTDQSGGGGGGGVAAAFFSSTRLKSFENGKNFLCLKIAEIDMGGQFWVEKKGSGHKTNIFFKLNLFSGDKYPNSMTSSLLQKENFVASYLQK